VAARALYYVARGLRWQVREGLDGWPDPGWPGKTYQKPVIQKQYRLRVSARCRSGLTDSGEFVMIATSYGNRDHWWIRPES
jgi:hypothetical protein